jgi:hypothetical protein
MKQVSVHNQTRASVLCPRCGVADNIVLRIRGLLGRQSLAPDEGLLIVPCPSIHMFGMKFSIDAVFITRDYVVTDVVRALAPGKMYAAKSHHGKAHAVIELSVGAIDASGTQLGDQLVAEPS